MSDCRFTRLFLGAAIAAASLLLLPAGSMAGKAKGGKGLGGIYNSRYCEIFVVDPPIDSIFAVNVFNTVGLNDCPREQWKAVDFDAIRTEWAALGSVANGPRRWTIDGISGGKAGYPFEMSGLEVRKVAVLQTPTLSPEPFTRLAVNRTTVWNYRKGRTVRILVAPNGRRYAMQSYTKTVDPDLTARDLNASSGNPLMALPDGWKFKTKKLRHRLALEVKRTAWIVRDGLGSVYQQFRWPNRR